jgi:hypothetical protein
MKSKSKSGFRIDPASECTPIGRPTMAADEQQALRRRIRALLALPPIRRLHVCASRRDDGIAVRFP